MTPRSPSKLKSPERLAAERSGRSGEALAAWYLRLKGYRIHAARVITPVGEIDLVAERFGTTVFVEVKRRGRDDSALEAFGAVNERRIIRAAEYYIAKHPVLASRTLRFDVIFLAPRAWPRHVVNAFDAS